MITEIQFKNFRAIEDATLELEPLTLLIGPNGSGKTSVLDSLKLIQYRSDRGPEAFRTLGRQNDSVSVSYMWTHHGKNAQFSIYEMQHQGWQEKHGPLFSVDLLNHLRSGIRHYAFDSAKMRSAVVVKPHTRLDADGSNLAGFLDYIRDNGADGFDAIKSTLHSCAPEFDDIGFDRPGEGQKSFKLRLTGTKHFVSARDLSEGTLYIVALLALLHQPEQPAILCIEEPDRGIHPRLYRQIYDIMQRLAYPKEFGETRAPVQIIATTHSPYFLNQFSDHPEQVVVCEKGPDHRVKFTNLGKDPEARRILEDSMIGDAWATGALGGVPMQA